MPQAIPVIAGIVVTGTLEAAGAYAWAAALAGAAASYGLTKVMGLDEPDKLRPPGAEFNVKGQVVPIPIVYGRRRVAASFATLLTTGSLIAYPGGALEARNTNLNIVAVWCEGEIESVETLYFDNDQSDSGRFLNHVGHWIKKGSDDQLASQQFLDELEKLRGARVRRWKESLQEKVETTIDPAEFWDADHRLRGVAYSYIRLLYNATVWPNGMPQVSALLQGRKVLDVRDGNWKWSDNPALIIYDYLTSSRFGRGLSAADMEVESFIEAANYCEQIVLFPDPQVDGGAVTGVSQSRYSCNALLNPDDTAIDNLRALLATCRGWLVYAGGKYALRLDAPEAPVFAFTEDNIVGGWSISPETTDSRYNRVEVQFPNKATRFEEDKRFVESSSYLSNDDGLPLVTQLSLSAVTDPRRAVALSGMALRQSRYSLRASFRANTEALVVEVGDVVTVTHGVPGWSAKEFRVLALELLPEDEVRVDLQEYSADVYSLEPTYESDSVPDTLLPDPTSIAAPWSLTAATTVEPQADGGVRGVMTLTWAHESDFVSGFVISYGRTGEAAASVFVGAETRSYPARDVVLGGSYTWAIKAMSKLGTESPEATLAGVVASFDDFIPQVGGLAGEYLSDGDVVRLTWELVQPQWIRRVRIYGVSAFGLDLLAEISVATEYIHHKPRTSGSSTNYGVALVDATGREGGYVVCNVTGVPPI